MTSARKSFMIICFVIVGLTVLLGSFYFGESVENKLLPQLSNQVDQKIEKPVEAVAIAEKEKQLPHELEVIATEFRRSRNLRAFVQKLKNSTAQGSIYYARSAIAECALFRSGFPSSFEANTVVKHPADEVHALNLARDSAFSFLRDRCLSFEGFDLFAEEQTLLKADGVKNDTIFALYKRLNKNFKPESEKQELEALVADVINTKNADLIRSLATKMAKNELPASFRSGNHLDSTEAYQYAWRLAACELGSGCGVDEIDLKMNCYLMSICEKNVQALVQREIERDGKGRVFLLEVDRLKSLIIQTVNQGDTSVFFSTKPMEKH